MTPRKVPPVPSISIALAPRVTFPYNRSAYGASTSVPVVLAGTALKPGGKRYAVSQYLVFITESIDRKLARGIDAYRASLLMLIYIIKIHKLTITRILNHLNAHSRVPYN